MSEFKFPDEVEKEKPEEIQVEVEGEGTPEIEVVDDTPEKDRGRAPMKEAPAEVTDDELAQYSEGVKKRIQHFSKGYHEERRAKEAALREREEALRLAQTLVEENKKLQGSLGQGQQALLEQAKKVVANEVDQAKAKLKAAHEAGDTEAFIAAIVPFSFVFINALTYKYGFFKSKQREGKEDLGMVYYAVSLLIITVVSFTFDVAYVGAMAVLIMGYGDSAATAVGRRFPLYSYRPFGSRTSLGGNLAMFAVSFVVAALVLSFSVGFNLLAVLTIAIVATLTEAFTPLSFDNLSVPLVVFSYYLMFFL